MNDSNLNADEYLEATLLFEKHVDPDEIISALEWCCCDNGTIFNIRLSNELNELLEKHSNNHNQKG